MESLETMEKGEHSTVACNPTDKRWANSWAHWPISSQNRKLQVSVTDAVSKPEVAACILNTDSRTHTLSKQRQIQSGFDNQQ